MPQACAHFKVRERSVHRLECLSLACKALDRTKFCKEGQLHGLDFQVVSSHGDFHLANSSGQSKGNATEAGWSRLY